MNFRHIGVAVVASVFVVNNPLALDLSQGVAIEVTAEDEIEWRRGDQVVIARGDARAVRDGVVVDADELQARYRPRSSEGVEEERSPRRAESPYGGANEIFRLEAEGNVRITFREERARGDRAVYDIDNALLVISGHRQTPELVTPRQTVTSRETLEYWRQRRMAVARGQALVVTNEGRRIAADTLVAHFAEPMRGGEEAGEKALEKPDNGSGLPEVGEVERVEAFGNVEIRTASEVITGARGVYIPETGMARLTGGVHIFRGGSRVAGQEAIVNMKTGVSRLVSAPGTRVQGVILPGLQAPAPR